MNLAEVWNSPSNAPTAVETGALVQDALGQIRRLRRRRTAFLVWTALTLTAATALAVSVASAQPDGTESRGALYLMLAAQWAAFLFVLRGALGRARVDAHGGIRDALVRLRGEKRTEQRGRAAVLALFAVCAPLLAAAVLALREAGKMAPHEATSAAFLFGGVLALGASVVAVRLYESVQQARRVDGLLRQYGGE